MFILERTEGGGKFKYRNTIIESSMGHNYYVKNIIMFKKKKTHNLKYVHSAYEYLNGLTYRKQKSIFLLYYWICYYYYARKSNANRIIFCSNNNILQCGLYCEK